MVIGIVIVIFLLGVINASAVVRLNAQLLQAYAALGNNARPVKPKDVIPPEIPKTQNALALYEEAASLLRGQSVGNKNRLMWPHACADHVTRQ